MKRIAYIQIYGKYRNDTTSGNKLALLTYGPEKVFRVHLHSLLASVDSLSIRIVFLSNQPITLPR